jgi:phospholipase C
VESASTSGAGIGLNAVEHIVVLMLENRSFDHMLGYLSLAGRTDIEGLTSAKPNWHDNQRYDSHPLQRTAFTKSEDPDHSAHAVDIQIGPDRTMDGFVTAYARALDSRKADLNAAGVTPDPGLVMGYYTGEQLPVYDHLAEHFCVCDHWHASVPGATWPNRLYSLTGRADGSRDDRPYHLPPIYDKPSFVRHLDAHGVSWRWYSYDPATLRCADAHYLLSHHEHFAFVDKRKLRWQTAAEEEIVIDEDSASFFEDAARGSLPSLAWVDPNFNDLNLFGAASNDDHPPSDVIHGQDLVLSIYNALASGPKWNETLLVITYDEHGGFYDHLPPPDAPDDDPKEFGHYGVRVPAIVISPLVGERSVSKTLFDHTSIIKTILLRFCPEALEKPSRLGAVAEWLQEGHPHYMGRRVAEAADLGELLTGTGPRAAPDRGQLIESARARRVDAVQRTFTPLTQDEIGAQTEAAGLTDLQQRIARAAASLRKKGLPPGHP